MDSELGRLIRTLKEKCPVCTHPMQLRARKIISLLRGVETIEEEEYKCCSVCDFESEIRDHKKRKQVFDKTAFVKEPVEEKKGRYDKNAKHPKRETTFKNNGRKGY